MSYGIETGCAKPGRHHPSQETFDLVVAHAETLAREGRWLDAQAALANVLAEDPRHIAAASLLVRVHLAQNQIEPACRTIEALAASGALMPSDLVLLRARLLLALSRFDESVDAFQTTIAAIPHDGAAELGLAVALGHAGRHEAAADSARAAIEKGYDTPGAHFVRSRALIESMRFDEAEVELHNVLRSDPAHAPAHANLVDLVWMRSGDAAAATATLDEALRKTDASCELHVLKSRLLDAAGETGRAYATLDAAIRRVGDRVELHAAAAQLSLKLDDAVRALRHAEIAHRYAMSDSHVLGILGDASLSAGNPERAAAIAERLLALDPDDGHAIALRASAWRTLGDARYRTLYDYARFVRVRRLDAPPGWPDLESYLADLARSLHRKHDALRAHPLTQTLRTGTQVELKLATDEPAITAFAMAIDSAVRRYLDEIDHGNDLLRRRNTGAYAIRESWSVRLRAGGYHTNHFHRRGWLSSACYIELPPADAGGSGWLKFGEPCLPTRPPLAAEYFVRPEPGLLVLFPSWMWHGTVPFAGNGNRTRLTIAFDIVPG